MGNATTKSAVGERDGPYANLASNNDLDSAPMEIPSTRGGSGSSGPYNGVAASAPQPVSSQKTGNGNGVGDRGAGRNGYSRVEPPQKMTFDDFEPLKVCGARGGAGGDSAALVLSMRCLFRSWSIVCMRRSKGVEWGS